MRIREVVRRIRSLQDAQENTDRRPALSRKQRIVPVSWPRGPRGPCGARRPSPRIGRVTRTPALGLLLLLASSSGPTRPAPPPTYGPPLNPVTGLVAAFGEYRPDHLHPGIDFSTGGRTGLPVFAVADGEIYRLKVEWRGYGRALYLRHRDGSISVYAHLESYEDRVLGLERRVERERRLKGMRYPGDIFLEPPLQVRRGTRLGTSGESGAGLPHLHFEIRREDQEPGDPLRPEWFRGLNPPPPVFEKLRLRSDALESWIDGARMEIGRAHV